MRQRAIELHAGGTPAAATVDAEAPVRAILAGVAAEEPFVADAEADEGLVEVANADRDVAANGGGIGPRDGTGDEDIEREEIGRHLAAGAIERVDDAGVDDPGPAVVRGEEERAH